MANLDDSEKLAYHGSYQQLQEALDTIYKEMSGFERGGTADRARIARASNEARVMLERWFDNIDAFLARGIRE